MNESHKVSCEKSSASNPVVFGSNEVAVKNSFNSAVEGGFKSSYSMGAKETGLCKEDAGLKEDE